MHRGVRNFVEVNLLDAYLDTPLEGFQAWGDQVATSVAMHYLKFNLKCYFLAKQDRAPLGRSSVMRYRVIVSTSEYCEARSEVAGSK